MYHFNYFSPSMGNEADDMNLINGNNNMEGKKHQLSVAALDEISLTYKKTIQLDTVGVYPIQGDTITPFTNQGTDMEKENNGVHFQQVISSCLSFFLERKEMRLVYHRWASLNTREYSYIK